MTESESHKRGKSKAAGKSGKTEKPIGGKRRVDAVTKIKATEIERSGSSEGLKKAAERLRDSRKRQKVLQVPEKDMKKATDAMREVGVSGTVKNMGGTKRKSVAARKSVKTKGTGSRKR